jgi:GNAT superfamily N-acetyltransferase
VGLAAAGDAPALSKLISLVFAREKDFTVDEDKQLTGVKMLLASAAARVFVARAASSPIGMCSAQLVISTATGGYKALVEDVVVAPDYRGKGLGRRLLGQVETWAAARQVKRLDLMADVDNEEAAAFYKRLGWTKTNLAAWQKKIL